MMVTSLGVSTVSGGKAGLLDSSQHPLPRGWAWTTLGQIRLDDTRTIMPGKTPERMFELYSVPSHAGGKPEILSGGNIGSNKQVVSIGYVLLSKINPRISRVWIVGDFSQHEKIASTEWISFAEVEGVDTRYLYYYMQGIRFRDFLALNASGVGGSLMRVRANVLDHYPLPLPPLAEQLRIVAKIEELFTKLDAGAAALKRAQAKLKRYRASVLKAACEGRLVPQDPSDEPASELLKRILAERRAKWEADELAKMLAQGMAPKDDKWKSRYMEPLSPDTSELLQLAQGWIWTTLDELLDHEANSITDGPFGSNLKTSHYTTTGPRVVRLQNIGDGTFIDARTYVSEEHFRRLRKHQVFPGDLVIAALGTTLPKACTIPESIGQAIVKADCIRVKPMEALVSTRYLSAALNSENTRRLAGRIVHGVGRPRLNLQQVRALPIPLPPRREQEAIADDIERLLSTVVQFEGTFEHCLARAERLRQSILKAAFEGKLGPQDPNDEPAEILLERIEREKAGREAKATPPKPRRTQRKRTDGRQLELI